MVQQNGKRDEGAWSAGKEEVAIALYSIPDGAEVHSERQKQYSLPSICDGSCSFLPQLSIIRDGIEYNFAVLLNHHRSNSFYIVIAVGKDNHRSRLIAPLATGGAVPVNEITS